MRSGTVALHYNTTAHYRCFPAAIQGRTLGSRKWRLGEVRFERLGHAQRQFQTAVWGVTTSSLPIEPSSTPKAELRR